MAGRIRTIKPEWLEDERLNACSDAAIRLTFVFLSLVDDDGRCRVSMRALGMSGWKFCDLIDDKTAHAASAVSELVSAGWLISYEVDGYQLWQIRNFTKHQKISHYTASKLPSPPESTGVRVHPPEPAGARRSSPEPAGALRPDMDMEGIRKGGGVAATPPPPDPLAASCDPSASRAIDAYRDGIGDATGKRTPVNHSGRFGQAASLLASLDGTEAERLGTIRRAAAVAAKDPDHRKANCPFAWFAANVGRYSTQAETPDKSAEASELARLMRAEQAARLAYRHDEAEQLYRQAQRIRARAAAS